MVQFVKTCRYCFLEKGLTITLKQNDEGEWKCPNNPSHKYIEDIEIA